MMIFEGPYLGTEERIYPVFENPYLATNITLLKGKKYIARGFDGYPVGFKIKLSDLLAV